MPAWDPPNGSNYSPLPVTFITGYLGAGKTTLLNRILAEDHGLRLAVIVNEFGDIDIDSQLVVGADEDIVALTNGCICCAIQGDLITTLGGLYQRHLQQEDGLFDAVVIETSGVFEPGPIVEIFFADPQIADYFRLANLVTVIDAKFVQEQLASNAEVQRQIAYADTLLLNKADLVTDEMMVQVTQQLRTVNIEAEIIATRFSDAPLPAVLHPVVHLDAADWRRRAGAESDNPPADGDHHHRHDHGDRAVRSMVLIGRTPLQRTRLRRSLDRWLAGQARQAFRYKGIVCLEDSPDAYVLQGVHEIYSLTRLRPWNRGEPQETTLVL
ncbi:MAG: GTP-binding protein, partial [Thermaerobacterales bacterium]